jgi:hypothetical protein
VNAWIVGDVELLSYIRAGRMEGLTLLRIEFRLERFLYTTHLLEVRKEAAPSPTRVTKCFPQVVVTL